MANRKSVGQANRVQTYKHRQFESEDYLLAIFSFPGCGEECLSLLKL
jgi:hypothetical protein